MPEHFLELRVISAHGQFERWVLNSVLSPFAINRTAAAKAPFFFFFFIVTLWMSVVFFRNNVAHFTWLCQNAVLNLLEGKENKNEQEEALIIS